MWALGTKLALFPFFISHFISQKKKKYISLKFSRQNHTLKLKKKKAKNLCGYVTESEHKF